MTVKAVSFQHKTGGIYAVPDIFPRAPPSGRGAGADGLTEATVDLANWRLYPGVLLEIMMEDGTMPGARADGIRYKPMI
jgi:hypothetical protein